MGKGAPAAPDPVQTINAQTGSNRETAIAQAGLNAVNQVTPNGNLSYSQIGTWADGTPRYQATQTLSAAGQKLQNTGQATQQNLANLAQQQSGRLGGLLNKELDFSSLPQGGQWENKDYSADRQRVEDGLFARLNPQIAQQSQAFEDSLVNRGLRPGSAAYDQQKAQFQQGINDQRTSILLQGGQEQSRLQGMDLNAFGAQNTQRANALNEMLTQRSLPLNEILALSGQSQVQTPQFASTPQTGVAGTDVAGITQAGYANQMQGYNAQQQQLGGLFSAGASLIPLLSDRRAKTEIKRIGTADNGLGLYLYRYKSGGPFQIGVMADEVEQVAPNAVVLGPDDFKRVNYAEAFA